MGEKLRNSGIDTVGSIPWGTHFCQLYQTEEDLIEITVPYFKAGLENNEFCLWIIPQTLDLKKAKESLRRAISDIDIYMEKGQIEIIPYVDWYIKDGVRDGILDPQRTLSYLIEKVNHLNADGYDGLRLSWDAFWLQEKNWNNSVNYEREIDEITGNFQSMVLCTYSLNNTYLLNSTYPSDDTYPLDKYDTATRIIDVVRGHQFALIKREGKWEQIEGFKRKHTEDDFMRRDNEFRTLAENSPDIITRFDRQNRHVYVNPAAAEVYGCPQEMIIGKTHTELGMDPEKVEFWEKHHENVFATGKPETMEFRYKSPQGREYYFNTRIVPEFVDGKVTSVLSISRDITNIKEAEARLKETLDNLESLVEKRTAELENAYNSLKEIEIGFAEAQKMAHLGNWDWNVVTNKLYWSDEIYRIFGRKPQEFGATYDAFLNYVHPDDRDYVNNAVKKALERRNGEIYNIDHRIILANGEERTVHEQGEVIFDEKNTPVQMRGIVQDITELKKAEEEIQILANAVETSDDAIITKSLDSTIKTWNRGAEQIYGYLTEEILGKNVSFLEPDSLKGEIKTLDETIKQGGKVRHYETLRLRKDGRIINVSITLSPVFDSSGKLIAISTVVRDITESKKAAEALRLSNIYNRSLIEASLDPLVTISPDGKITDLNEATELVTGYSREELIGTDFSNYFTEQEKAKEGYKQVFREGTVHDYSLEIENKDGHITPVLYNASLYRDENDEVIGIFAAARDITERKKAEKMLELKLEELARSNAELEQFAYVASHDLQEPLRMIASYLQLLQRKYQGKLDDKADKYIHFAVDGASRLQNLINDLLELSRVTTRAQEFEPVDCEIILDNVLSDLEVFIKENEATIYYDSLPRVMADPVQLSQLFRNLISNAIKFRSEEAPEIYISAKKEDDQWLFSIQDNGIGIDPKYSEKIFEIFKRLHRKEEYSGTGIGLSICKKIIERHGGHIWVDSEPGQGSTFYFTLPANPENFKEFLTHELKIV